MKRELWLAPLSRPRAVLWWLTIALLAAAASAIVWPEPYVFHVSQLAPIGVEEVDGQLVQLDNWEDGYTKLHAFRRQRTIVVLLAAAAAASVVLALAAAIFARDTSWYFWLSAWAVAAIAMRTIERFLPPVVDPVYGTGFQHFFPWWIELAGSFVFAVVSLAPLYLLRRWFGRFRNRTANLGTTTALRSDERPG